MKQCLLNVAVITIVLICTSCASFCRIDGPYEGKVVDADTKQPLEGVVVLGVWNKVYPNVAGSTSEFYDSVELLTDKNGEFKIPGKGLTMFSNLDEMDVVIFKAGYEMLGYGPWADFKTRTGGKNVIWNGNKALIMLRKMSFEQRKKRILGTPGLDRSRENKLIHEINKENLELGKGTL